MQDSPKVNVFCAISKKSVYGPFFLKKQRSTVKRILLCFKIDRWKFCLRESEKIIFSNRMGHHLTGVSREDSI